MEKYQILIKQIRTFFDQHQLTRVIIGLSGGIDSALSAMLHVAALGKESVILVNLPSHYNSQQTQAAAAELARNLDCQYLVIPIDSLVTATKTTLKNATDQITWPIVNPTDENIQARTRGAVILAGLCGYYGAVFPCNGNKNEIEVGYATVMGDLAGYGCPLGDLWKSEVYQQAKLLSAQLGNVLPAKMLCLPPSAELSAAQAVDAGLGDEMVDTYHEALFQHWQTISRAELAAAYQKKQLTDLLALTSQQVESIYQQFANLDLFLADYDRWWQLKQHNHFKLNFLPPVFKVTTDN